VTVVRGVEKININYFVLFISLIHPYYTLITLLLQSYYTLIIPLLYPNYNLFKCTGWLVIEVSDSGAGISRENQSQLFYEIVQFDVENLEAGRGSGLGLWLSKGIYIYIYIYVYIYL
jgi:signal transduction histidine kinase